MFLGYHLTLWNRYVKTQLIRRLTEVLQIHHHLYISLCLNMRMIWIQIQKKIVPLKRPHKVSSSPLHLLATITVNELSELSANGGS